MRILVTAGNTQAPIDRVRCLTNIFTGRTGAAIAKAAVTRGHGVVVITSHPNTVVDLPDIRPYRDFDEFGGLFQRAIEDESFDAVIHAAAVSDYLCAGVFEADRSRIIPERERAGKIKSDASELWLRLVRAPKLVDRVREPWGFQGVLVKFKLEVGTSEADLLDIAERSRRHSQADLMVANELDTAGEWAYLGPISDESGYQKIPRGELADRLIARVENEFEQRHQERR